MTVRFIASAVIAALLLTGTAAVPQPTENGASAAPKATTAAPALTREDVQAIALEDTGVLVSQVTDLRAHLDKDRNGTKWEVEFRCGDYEYEVDIHPDTGEVLQKEKEFDPIPTPPAPPATEPPAPTQPPATEPPVTEALDPLAIALAHAGLTADQVTRVKTEKDLDDGKWVFEVEFNQGPWEFEYEICAETGKVLDFEKELDD